MTLGVTGNADCLVLNSVANVEKAAGLLDEMCIRDSYITWKIVDKKVAKRTAVQEQIILPLRAQNYATRCV